MTGELSRFSGGGQRHQKVRARAICGPGNVRGEPRFLVTTALPCQGPRPHLCENQVLQMIGRAGRPQFDDRGLAVIITDTDSEVTHHLAPAEKTSSDMVHGR
jgi:hypothetical protein